LNIDFIKATKEKRKEISQCAQHTCFLFTTQQQDKKWCCSRYVCERYTVG